MSTFTPPEITLRLTPYGAGVLEHVVRRRIAELGEHIESGADESGAADRVQFALVQVLDALLQPELPL